VFVHISLGNNDYITTNSVVNHQSNGPPTPTANGHKLSESSHWLKTHSFPANAGRFQKVMVVLSITSRRKPTWETEYLQVLCHAPSSAKSEPKFRRSQC